LKNVRLRFVDSAGRSFDRLGECVLTATGIEGSLVYAASALLRDEIAAHGSATLRLDLVPQHAEAVLAQRLGKGRAARSLPNHLREQAGLHGATLALLRERWSAEELQAWLLQPAALAQELKAWPLVLNGARPIDEAISSAGGVALEALDEGLMLKALPGVFCAGEMLDWEAPTGGYLLSACLASGRVAGQGAAQWCRRAR
jgi:predicted flavoprotein YhiN